MAREIKVEIVGDSKSLEKALSKSQKSTSSFEKGLSAAARGGAVALAGLGVAAVYSVNAASNLSEQINKTNVVFRGSEKQIQAWSETTAASFGISQRAALEAAGTFGNMLVPMGIARGEAGKMSTKMVELAADMASFNNASPEDTLLALRSGLAGETEPLRKFGVFLNEARINQEALNLGLSDGERQLTAAEKATATYSIIMKDTADAQGDFARTSDSLANQQRILRAELEDVAAELGNALIPAATGAASVLLELVNWTKENETAAKALVVAVAALSGGLILARASLAIYTSSALVALGATRGLTIAMAATPWGLAALAAAGLVAVLISQRDKSDAAKTATDNLASALRNYKDALDASKGTAIDFEAAQLRVQRAEISVQQAIVNRNKVDKDSNSTLADRRAADLAVAEAMNNRRRAELDLAAATDKQWDANVRNNVTMGEVALSATELAQIYRQKLVTAGQSVIFNQATQSFQVRQGAVSLDTAQKNARAYAAQLRGLATATEGK